MPVNRTGRNCYKETALRDSNPAIFLPMPASRANMQYIRYLRLHAVMLMLNRNLRNSITRAVKPEISVKQRGLVDNTQ
jgi:hypothetical protein